MWKNRFFALLALGLACACLELGSFALLSLVGGEIRGYGDTRRLQESRQDSATLRLRAREKDWREHRIARPPALHPYLGYVTNPVDHPAAEDPRFDRRAAEYGVPYNAVDLFRPVDPGEVVIGVFGGSFAADLAAGGTALADELKRQTQAFAGREVTVLTFALGGHKQPQQLMALNWFLALGVHLDVVINLDGFNEVALPPTTNVPKGYHPFYPRGWLLMVDDLDQELRLHLGELSYRKARRAAWAARFRRLGFSMTAGLVWQILDGSLSRRITEAEVALLEQERSPSADYQARGPGWEVASEGAMYDQLAAMWQRASLQMDGVCQSRGIRYLHFLQPNQYLPGSKPLSAAERKVAWDDDQPYKIAVEKGYPALVRLGDELRREGVDFHDLTRVFADDDRPYYRDSCCHLNHQGYLAIAGRIAAAIDTQATNPTE